MVHFFGVETEIVLVEWINSISYTCAVHIAEEEPESLRESKNEEIEEDLEDLLDEETENIDEINMRKALQAQRLQEKKEKQAATLLQNFWKMLQQRKIYLQILKLHKSARFIFSCYQRYKAQKIFMVKKKQHRYRVNVQREMLSTENSYLDGLKAMIDCFLTPLKAQELINPPQIVSVFSNIESIASLHQYLLNELTSRISGEIHPYATIGHIFIFLVRRISNPN